MLTGATPMRLASVPVSSLNLQRGEVVRPKAKWWQKTAPKSGSARIMRKNPTPSPRTMFESQPAPVRCTTCSSYLTYLYLYLYVKKEEKNWETNKLPFRKKSRRGRGRAKTEKEGRKKERRRERKREVEMGREREEENAIKANTPRCIHYTARTRVQCTLAIL